VTGNRIRIPRGPARQCTRCGALGTHYLTCPLLQLPRGYRLDGDQLLSTRFPAGKPPATRRAAPGNVSSAEAALYRLPSQAGAAGPGGSARGQRPVTGHRLDTVS
jgi:hypothetical protein